MTTEDKRTLKMRLIKAGYKPGFELEEALDKFQPDEPMDDETLAQWVRDNRPKSQTKMRNR